MPTPKQPGPKDGGKSDRKDFTEKSLPPTRITIPMPPVKPPKTPDSSPPPAKKA